MLTAGTGDDTQVIATNEGHEQIYTVDGGVDAIQIDQTCVLVFFCCK